MGATVAEAAVITTETNVDELLTRWPGAVRVFLHRRMLCPGCPLARFETVAEVSAIYRQPLGPFLAELRQVAITDRPDDNPPDPRRSSP